MNVLLIISTAFHAVMPICLLMLTGYVLKQREFVNEQFLTVGNKLVFQLLLPAMLFVNVYQIEKLSDIPWSLIAYAAGMLLALFGLGLILAPMITPDARRRGVLLSNTFRGNTAIIGLALAQVLGGTQAIAVAAVVNAFSVPIINMLGVVALTIYLGEDGRKPNFRDIAKKVLTNPLIDWIAAAFVCIIVRMLQVKLFGRAVFTISGQLGVLFQLLKQLGSMTTPLSLLILGGQFTFSAVGDMKKEIGCGVLTRLVLTPAIGLGGAWLLTNYGVLSCGTSEYPALIALFGTPTAVASAIMARQMGNDGQLATQMVAWTSALSMLSLFGIVCILLSAGLLAV